MAAIVASRGVKDGVIFTSFPVEGTRKQNWVPTMTPEAKGALESYSFEAHKSDRLMEGVSDFEVTADGQTMLVRAGDRLRAAQGGREALRVATRPDARRAGLDLDRVKVSDPPGAPSGGRCSPRPGACSASSSGSPIWAAWTGARYATATRRWSSASARARELSDLFWEMQGELGSSHAYEFGGEYRARPNYRQGYLGVDWRFDAKTGRYTIARILRGDPWEADATSPLLSPGVNCQVGDAVLAINGQRVTPERGPRQLLVNQAGAEVLLTCSQRMAARARR